MGWNVSGNSLAGWGKTQRYLKRLRIAEAFGLVAQRNALVDLNHTLERLKHSERPAAPH